MTEHPDLLLSAYLDEALAPDETDAVRAHLDGCADCQRWWHQAARLERLLSQLPAPPAPDTALDHRSSHNETFAELLREGEDLRALGRLLKLDLTPYGNQLSKALAAARAGRFEQCGLYLQVANERLRFQVHAALAEELLSLRSPAFDSR